MNTWIDINNRLPDDDRRVFVCGHAGWLAIALYCHETQTWYDDNNAIRKPPKYWLELAEPPEPEDTQITAEAMKRGDIVEFLSDRQSHKGPSSGRCIARWGQTAVIRHSDAVQYFNAATLIVKELTTAAERFGGGPLWQLA